MKPLNGPGIGCIGCFWKFSGWRGLKRGRLFKNLFKEQSESQMAPPPGRILKVYSQERVAEDVYSGEAPTMGVK